MITREQFEQETKGKEAVSRHKDAAFWTEDYYIGGKLVRYSSLNTFSGNNGIQRSEME